MRDVYTMKDVRDVVVGVRRGLGCVRGTRGWMFSALLLSLGACGGGSSGGDNNGGNGDNSTNTAPVLGSEGERLRY